MTLADKPLRYSEEKNRWLIKHRGVSFPEIIALIADGNVLDIIDHPNKKAYPTQKMMVIMIEGYPWGVPIVEESDHIFLKTAFPSRELKRFIKGDKK